jgi:hypothetical protein
MLLITDIILLVAILALIMPIIFVVVRDNYFPRPLPPLKGVWNYQKDPWAKKRDNDFQW